MPEKEVVETINKTVTVYGPVFMTLFFLGTSIVYGELRGYIIMSMLLLSIVLGYIIMTVLDIFLSYGLHFAKMAPRILPASEPVSCMNLLFSGTNLGHKLNLSTFMYIFVMTYLLTCANSQYYNSHMLFPRFAGFIVVFGYLSIHSSVASVLQACGGTTVENTAEATGESESEARRMGKVATLIYYNFLTVCIAMLLGYGSADLILKTKTPELIHFSPQDSYSEGCRRSSLTEFKCDMVAANGTVGATSDPPLDTTTVPPTPIAANSGATVINGSAAAGAVSNPSTSGKKEAKKVRGMAATTKRFGKSVSKVFKTKKK